MSACLLSLAASLAAAAALGLAALWLRREARTLKLRVQRDERELERLQRSFARFAPADLVERIVGEGQPESGERREVTVMFADIRGFTPLSERLDPAVLIEMLNGYFAEMAAVIRAHHGHVTRIMGDGLMCVFGALQPNPWHAQDGVAAAVGMREALERYNGKLRERGLPELRFGIGIHCGTVVTGLVGSEELLEFTVMGDAVNVAARIESLTRRLEADILVSGAVRERLGGRYSLREMPPSPLRGKTEPFPTWAVAA